MAAVCRKVCYKMLSSISAAKQTIKSSNNIEKRLSFCGLTSCCVACYLFYRYGHVKYDQRIKDKHEGHGHFYQWTWKATEAFRSMLKVKVLAESRPVAADTEAMMVPNVAFSQRERRFQGFASVEYNGNIYMTPQDFLDSVCHEEPRVSIGRVVLSKSEVAKWLEETPPCKESSEKLFRSIKDRGVISYTEYLFLLCVLTKPRSGFQIAFNMFDTDGNAEVDKKEFLVMERTLSKIRDERSGPDSKEGDSESMEEPKLKYLLNGGRHRAEWDTHSPSGVDENHQDTTLLIHLFGRSGEAVLQYKAFCKFMTSLQTEVLEVEFNEFSQGKSRITEEDFARILLRYTSLSNEEMDEYVDRLKERIPDGLGICFDDFHDFCQFLNHLEDFNVAIGLYTLSGLPVSQDEFKRAVKICTDVELDAALVNTVFQIFDTDGDGDLSHKEFVSIMKNRLSRRVKIQDKHLTLWETFKGCLKDEMRYN